YSHSLSAWECIGNAIPDLPYAFQRGAWERGGSGGKEKRCGWERGQAQDRMSDALQRGSIARKWRITDTHAPSQPSNAAQTSTTKPLLMPSPIRLKSLL